MIWQLAFTRGRAARHRVFAIMGGLLVAGQLSAAPDRLRVQSIAIAEQGTTTVVDLRLSRSAQFNLFTLSSPHRVVIDISSAALGPTALPLPGAAGAIRQIRVAHRPGGNLRIVFDVAEAMRPTATPAGDERAPVLAIELRPVTLLGASSSTPRSPPAASPPAIPPAAQPMAAAVAAAVAPAFAPGPPAPGPGPAPRVVRPPAAGPDIVVVVDAGHGGHDPGAHGPSGTREKDVTLAISRRLVALLNEEPGMRGVLTRTDDRFLGLRERMERARRANASLFISIHADAAYNRSAQGSTVYVLSEKAASDEASRRLAARENAALIGGVDLGDKDPVLASVLMDLSQNASISSSIAAGDAILGKMGRLGRLHRRTVQQAPFMVLKSPDVPSVLVETAYISNPTDERNLRSVSHQQKLASAILDGIRKYFAANPPANPASRPATTLAAAEFSPGVTGDGSAGSTARRPQQHVIRRGDTLSGVASLYRVSLSSLRAANRLRSDTVRIGQKLRIPAEST
ncbi:MAG: N-acetylmuramoyl-L-alanine amidase [Gammaproteobacteria bacterium]|nr:N-acetylmuramoyl-L-alanine amidase [Gammaproteobacteria bacterium]